MGVGGYFPCGKAAEGVKLTTDPHLGAEVKSGGVIIKAVKRRDTFICTYTCCDIGKDLNSIRGEARIHLSVLFLF
jgi:hypothetical protein